jgi:tRNA(Ile)-lysidine synthase
MSLSRLQTEVARSLRPVAEGSVLVAGLSGGADSVALLHVLRALSERHGFRLVAAHLDHGLRGDSAADAAFCRRLCRRLGVALRVGRADVRARAVRDGGGIEEAARLERRAFLEAVRVREGADWIVLAHTRNHLGRASRILGLDRNTCARKARAFGLVDEPSRGRKPQAQKAKVAGLHTGRGRKRTARRAR